MPDVIIMKHTNINAGGSPDMPMKYNPDTGIPYYELEPLGEPDWEADEESKAIKAEHEAAKRQMKLPLGGEIEEGVTPKATKPTYINKTDPFKGDKPLTQEEYEKLRDGPPPNTAEAEKMLGDLIGKGVEANLKYAKLDARVATDEEVDELEKLAGEHSILHWATLLRLINRLRRAEGKQ